MIIRETNKNVKSLQHICIKHTSFKKFAGLPVHIQRCLFPYTVHIGRLQRLIINRRRTRMKIVDEKLLAQVGLDLSPKNAVRKKVVNAGFAISPGEHLVVPIRHSGGMYHHGLYIGVRGDDFWVAEFGKSEGRKRLQLVPYFDFVKVHKHVYIVPYDSNSDEAGIETTHRTRAVEIAQDMMATNNPDFNKYDILRWDCECFVLMCKTGRYQVSEQAMKFLQWIYDDIRSQQSTIGTVLIACRVS
jgi:hypothetical protein